MGTKTITVSGEDKDELVAGLTEALEMLGAEAPAAETEEETEEEDLTGDEETEEVDENEALRDKLKAAIPKLSKDKKNIDKIKAALKKGGGSKLSEVDDSKLKIVAKMLGVKV